VDGIDLEIFNTIQRNLPTLVCIEGGQMLPPLHPQISLDKARRNVQQSLSVMNGVFSYKGYVLLASYQDSFFIKKEYADRFDVGTDLMRFYLDGLKAIPRRLPFIQKCLKKVGLRNEIVETVLRKSRYKSYGWNRRKDWAKEQKQSIFKAVESFYIQDQHE
jgi:hypothetical protein